MYSFETVHEGDVIDLGSRVVDAASIVEFAASYDPQPFHMSEEAGRNSPLGGLAASGWHVCALMMRMMCDAYLVPSRSLGAPGVEEIRWRRPLLAGTLVSGRTIVGNKRKSARRPELGLIELRHELEDDLGNLICSLSNTSFVLLDGHSVSHRLPVPSEILDPGMVTGTHVFTEMEIIDFARKYDPQPFHLDRRAARQSLFGDLCASGWHICAQWMPFYVEADKRDRNEALLRSVTPPEYGPSPGIRNLKWHAPVYPDQEIRFFHKKGGLKPSRQAGWMIRTGTGGAVDKDNRPVMTFDNASLIKPAGDGAY